MKKIGFVGLGIMGKPMALNLFYAGIELLVNDIDGKVLQEMEEKGVSTASLAKIGKECDIIFTILPKGSIVKKVIFGEGGLDLPENKGTLVCDMSSVTPTDSRQCYEELSKKGIGFVDAPVSGGEPKAIDGTLAFMVGGEERDHEKLRPYFEIMGSNSVLIGETGSGSTAKLANQIIVNLTIVAVSEAFVLAKKAGADPQKVYEAIRVGLAGSQVLDAKVPMILKRDFSPGGKLSINHKDIKNVLETADDLKQALPFTAQLLQVMEALSVSGGMEDDHCGMIKYFERLADVEVIS